MYRQKKRMLLWTSIMIIIIGMLAGCSSANNNGESSKAASDSDTTKAETAEGGGAMENSLAEADDASGDQAAEDQSTSATDSAAGTGFAAGTVSSEEGFNQKIIYTATLSMQVDELEAAATALRNAIHQSGGYILQFQDTRYDGEIGASYTIKVPAAGFMSFIDRVEGIEHKEFERNIAGKDVSEEYVDLESRLKASKLVEERLLAMMNSAVKADDLLKFSQQLSEVQERIEQFKGRIRYLDNNVSFSTVELRMYQTDQTIEQAKTGNSALGGRMSDALTGSTKVVWEGLKLLLIILAGALPVAAVLAVIVIPIIWLARRKRSHEQQIQTQPEEEQQPPTV